MKTNYIKAKITAIVSALSVIIGGVTPVYAGTYNTDGSATVPITATVAGSYTVTLPALIDAEIKESSSGAYLKAKNTEAGYITCSVDLQKNKLIEFAFDDYNNAYAKIKKDGVDTDLYVAGLDGFIVGNLDRTHLKSAVIAETNYNRNDSSIVESIDVKLYDDDDNEIIPGAGDGTLPGWFLLYNGTPERPASNRYGSYFFRHDETSGEFVKAEIPMDDFMTDYGPRVYAADIPFTWRTVTIPAVIMED